MKPQNTTQSGNPSSLQRVVVTNAASQATSSAAPGIDATKLLIMLQQCMQRLIIGVERHEIRRMLPDIFHIMIIRSRTVLPNARFHPYDRCTAKSA